MISLPAVRLLGDKPCPRLEPSPARPCAVTNASGTLALPSPSQLSLTGDLLATAGFFTSLYPRMDHLLLKNTAAVFQAQNRISGGCRSQVG